jgi:hypothetical protein
VSTFDPGPGNLTGYGRRPLHRPLGASEPVSTSAVGSGYPLSTGKPKTHARVDRSGYGSLPTQENLGFFWLDRVGLICDRLSNDPPRGWRREFPPHRYPQVHPSDRCIIFQHFAGASAPRRISRPPKLPRCAQNLPIGGDIIIPHDATTYARMADAGGVGQRAEHVAGDRPALARRPLVGGPPHALLARMDRAEVRHQNGFGLRCFTLCKALSDDEQA